MLSLIDWGDKEKELIWPQRLLGTNCSFRREVFQEIGFFDTQIGRFGNLLLGSEETEIQKKIQKFGKIVFYSPDAIVFHHVPEKRLRKIYFFQRNYGSGRTDAILELRNENKIKLIKRFVMMIIDLNYNLFLLIANIFQERKIFGSILSISYAYGFISQTIISLTTRVDRK